MDEKIMELTKEDIKGNAKMAITLLSVAHPYALPLSIEERESSYIIQPDTQNTETFDIVATLPLEEKLRYLINVGQLYDSLKTSIYTYTLIPNNIVFTQDGIAKIVHRGVRGQVPPYELEEHDIFLANYQALVVSVLDTKTDFESLSQGKLAFYKGHKFCEEIVHATTVDDIITLLKDHLEHEKQRVTKEMVRVPQRQLFTWKLVGIISSALLIILTAVLSYSIFVTQPQQEMISHLRLAFIQKDYSRVVSSAKTMDSRGLTVDDKYIVAYSVIMTEPLTEVQKTTLGNITTQTNEDYLRYWVLIGQNNIDESMDIASFLDDPQLLMYSLTKKIDDIQRNPNLTSEERTEAINNYKAKLEELKKQYLPDQTPKNN